MLDPTDVLQPTQSTHWGEVMRGQVKMMADVGSLPQWPAQRRCSVKEPPPMERKNNNNNNKTTITTTTTRKESSKEGIFSLNQPSFILLRISISFLKSNSFKKFDPASLWIHWI